MGSARREPIRRAARLISWQGKAPHQKNGRREIGLLRSRRSGPPGAKEQSAITLT
jgi:hypothetical protein